MFGEKFEWLKYFLKNFQKISPQFFSLYYALWFPLQLFISQNILLIKAYLNYLFLIVHLLLTLALCNNIDGIKYFIRYLIKRKHRKF